MGTIKLYAKLIATQIKTRFKKRKEYHVPRCGVSFTRMTKLANEVNGINIVENQDTKSTTFRVTSKAPEVVFSFASQLGEHIMGNIASPSRKDQKKLNELGAYLKQLEPLMTDFELYKEASTLLK
ncbi:hypothetical protein N9R81_00170 [Flavobacteriales bacterium]|nr:hypothetical protein [Flavobacteriales bacterium]